MKQSFFGVFTLFAHFLLAQTAHIAGTVTNYHPENDGHYVMFSSLDFEKPVKKLAQIDEKGRFKVALDITDLTEVQVRLRENIALILVDKGDAVVVEIQSDSTHWRPQWRVKEGKLRTANQQLAKHIGTLDSLEGDIINAFGTMTANDSFQLYARSTLARAAFWQQEHPELDPVFVRYFSDFLHFCAFHFISTKPFRSGNKTMLPTDPYLAFAYDPNTATCQFSRNTEKYYNFVRMGGSFIHVAVDNNPQFEQERALWGDPADRHLKARQFKTQMQKLPSQDVRNAMYKSLFQWYKTIPELWESPEQMEAIAQQVKLQNSGNVYDILREFEAPATVKKELEMIFAPAKDKPLLLDLWMEHCVLCYAGFPKMEEAHTQLADQVAFAYLAGDTPRDAWQTISAEKGLTGPNYLLSPDAQLYFKAFFDLYGYPQYILIDKGGEIVSKKYSFRNYEHLKTHLLSKP